MVCNLYQVSCDSDASVLVPSVSSDVYVSERVCVGGGGSSKCVFVIIRHDYEFEIGLGRKDKTASTSLTLQGQNHRLQ